MSDQLELFVAEAAPEKRPVETWAAEKSTELHWFEAAKYAQSWGLGSEVSEDVYDAAVLAVQTIILRS